MKRFFAPAAAPDGLRFSNHDLVQLIGPLMLEQLLVVTVGMADTIMVSVNGEAAVSGISLVDQINILIIQVFAALATGGAVVASQYLGRRDPESARTSGRQLMYAMLALSLAVAVPSLVWNGHILTFVFGAAEPDVMAAAETYFWLSALSYPFIGIYNAGAALFRSMGNSRVSLFASAVMNVINIGGNAILIFIFKMGVAGAATASLASRAAAATLILWLLRSEHNPIHLRGILKVRLNGSILRSILRVGIPSGMENGMFQIGKLLVASLITSFGTVAITANAICNNIASFSNIPGSALGLAMITVIGQCVGARDYVQTRYYVRKLMWVSFAGIVTLNIVIFLISPLLVGMYGTGKDTYDLALFVIRFNCFCGLWWVPSFTMPNALRAAGDAKYTMVVSMISMWLFRVASSYVLGIWLGLGLFGVWAAMTIDWGVRAVVFMHRYFSGKWQNARVIDG